MAKQIALPHEADTEMVDAAVKWMPGAVDELRGTRLMSADREFMRRAWRLMAQTYVRARLAEARIAELRAAGLTVSAGQDIEGETVFKVSGPNGQFGYMPTHSGDGTWWLARDHKVRGVSTRELIRRATEPENRSPPGESPPAQAAAPDGGEAPAPPQPQSTD